MRPYQAASSFMAAALPPSFHFVHRIHGTVAHVAAEGAFETVCDESIGAHGYAFEPLARDVCPECVKRMNVMLGRSVRGG